MSQKEMQVQNYRKKMELMSAETNELKEKLEKNFAY